MMDSASVRELLDDLRSGELSARELADSTLRAIDESQSSLHAWLAVADEAALEDAAGADRARQRGKTLGPLHGIPVAVKDLQETRGLATSFGTRALRDHVPPEDAIAVQRLRRAGAIVIGKTNTPAFGALGETKNRLGPDCRNARRPELTSGGSSGGSASALAAGTVGLATGTDSAGSISCPASFCGVVGMKPTRGLVPHWPAPDDSLLLNNTGPMARNVGDLALMLEVMAGPDPRDPLSQLAPRLRPSIAPEPSRLRIAYTPELGHFAVDSEVYEVTSAAIRVFADWGAEVEHAHPAIDDPLQIYMPIYCADFRRWSRTADPAVLEELFEETVEELEAHPPLADEDYAGVINRLWRLEAGLERFFERFDFLLSPATACAAFEPGKPPVRLGGRAVRPGWQSFMPFQVPWNLVGYPTITVPAGSTADGRPVGLLIAGRRGNDRALLEVGARFEASGQADVAEASLTTDNSAPEVARK